MKYLKIAALAVFISIMLTNITTAQDRLYKINLFRSYSFRPEAFIDFKPPDKCDEKPYLILMDKSIKLNFTYIEPIEMYVIAEKGLWIRKDSHVESQQVGFLSYGESIIVDGITPDKKWYHTDRGYISSKYVQENSVYCALDIADYNSSTNGNKRPENREIQSTGTYLGVFKLTYYCSCSVCCGKSSGKTASGTYPVSGQTISVDPNIISLGSHVIINGHEYIAEDTGGVIKGNVIDVYMNSHQAALQAGVQYAEVYLK